MKKMKNRDLSACSMVCVKLSISKPLLQISLKGDWLLNTQVLYQRRLVMISISKPFFVFSTEDYVRPA